LICALLAATTAWVCGERGTQLTAYVTPQQGHAGAHAGSAHKVVVASRHVVAVQESQALLQAAQQGMSDRDEALDALADELVEVNTGLEEAEAARQQAEQQVRWVCTVANVALLLKCRNVPCRSYRVQQVL
jgi:hypothetical protein